MGEQYLDQMRDYLTVIHDEFEELYKAQNNESFAMDIEYKITSADQLIIKQARPWVSFVPKEDSLIINPQPFSLNLFPNPAQENIKVQCKDCGLKSLTLTNSIGQIIQTIELSDTNNLNTEINISNLPLGIYILSGLSNNNDSWYSMKFIKK